MACTPLDTLSTKIGNVQRLAGSLSKDERPVHKAWCVLTVVVHTFMPGTWEEVQRQEEEKLRSSSTT